MTNTPRAEVVIEMIREGKDDALLSQMERSAVGSTLDEYMAFVEIMIVLIERSRLHNSATELFVNRLLRNRDLSEELALSSKHLGVMRVLRERALLPYVRTGLLLRRILLEMFSYPNGYDGRAFRDFFSPPELLETCEAYQDRFLSKGPLTEDVGMNLLYNCIAGREQDGLLRLGEKACDRFRNELYINPQSRFYYLSNFFRPMYITNNESFPQALMHVAEPFYMQIFGNRPSFINFLERESQDNRERVLKSEILNVVESLAEPGDEFDISLYRINGSLHKNVRLMVR